MNDKKRAVAEKFAVYSKLSPLDQWRFRNLLRWVSLDAVSLELLLDFEKKQEAKSVFSLIISDTIMKALSWYNREDHDDRLKNRLQRDRLPEMLQIVLFFLAKSQHLHKKYRVVILNIIRFGDNIGSNPKVQGITPEQFRLEAAAMISNLNDRWHEGWNSWYDWLPYLENSADLPLSYLENIASKVSDLQLFTLFRLQAESAFSRDGSREQLGYLERIADKVNDLRTFTLVFQDVVPVFGVASTASLMAISKDFQEFEVYYDRIKAQQKEWRFDYIVLFCKAKSISELDRLLIFLETLAKNARMAKYVHYTQIHPSGTLYTCISGALLAHKQQVFDACYKYDWENEPENDRFMDSLIGIFEHYIVHTYLGNIWQSILKPSKIRWEFDKFTDYVPFDIRTWDWTNDNEKTRAYWNSMEAESREYNRYIHILEPQLVSIFRSLDFSEIEVLFDLLPNYLGIQEFARPVKIPEVWEKDTIVQEGYQLHVGFYDEKVEVARPKTFVEHTFTFQRPYLQNAIDLLENMDKAHEAIQAYKKSRQ